MDELLRTVSNSEFIKGLEDGTLEWPPLEAGNYLYARLTNPDTSQVGYEFIRTVTP